MLLGERENVVASNASKSNMLDVEDDHVKKHGRKC